MNGKQLWYGYLDAGVKSSPVAIDPRLDTGNPKTQFIFNMARGEILEYSREIVTSKLRELRADEADTLLKELQTAHQRAQAAFKGRPIRVSDRPVEPAALGPRHRARLVPEEVLDLESDDLAEDAIDE